MIRPHAAGTAVLPDAASVTGGHALLAHPSGARHALLRDGDALVLLDLVEAFGGREAVLARVPNPWPGHRLPAGAATEGGDLVVLPGHRSVRALEADGRTRWEHRHGCRADGPHRHEGEEPCSGRSWHGSCGMSPDGTVVWAHVLPDLDHSDPDADSHEEWLVLDATDGAVLGRARIEGGSQGSHHLPHPDDGLMLLATGQGQDGSPAYLGHWDGTALTVRELGDGFRIPTSVHPSGRAFLSTPHSGGPLHLHRLPDGTALTGRHADDLSTGPGHRPRWDYVAGFVDPHTVVAGTYDLPRHDDTRRHWLLDALTLRPLGRIDYPVPVAGHPVGLGDGSWVTAAADGTALHRWSRTSGSG
ncbi:hypothetical protein ACIA8O_31215 [Kitasatospora sp. NPDC051853]|uniref:hypothetical protein n=1 Tax=Kitasatospora sp. NPDC051853 TaxID=3364058 RepID=UPI0037A19A6A